MATPLRYDADGKVLWGDIRTTYCDLALVGGPPHRGKLPKRVSLAAAMERPDDYKTVVDEIARGVLFTMVLTVNAS